MSAAIHSIIVPNPFFEGRNRVYVIQADPVTLIDTGVATSRGFEALKAGLKEHRLRVEDVRRIVLTHKHVDHAGNAWRIQQTSGAEIWIHSSECEAIAHPDPSGEKFRELVAERLAEWQAPDQVHSPSLGAGMPRWEMEAAEVHGLVDGQRLEFDHGALHVVHTPGHTVGSICLRYESRLFTGDHVLPGISPNIGGGDLRHAGLLAQFLNSLERIRSFDEIELALPGHGDPWTQWKARCRELIEHHVDRLDQVETILTNQGPLTAYELAKCLFGEMDDFHLVLGCAEAHAHLEWLVERRRVHQTSDSTRFQMVTGPPDTGR